MCIHHASILVLILLIARDAAVNGCGFAGVDNDERKTNGRVLSWSSQGGHSLPIALHQVLIGEDLDHNAC